MQVPIAVHYCDNAFPTAIQDAGGSPGQMMVNFRVDKTAELYGLFISTGSRENLRGMNVVHYTWSTPSYR